MAELKTSKRSEILDSLVHVGNVFNTERDFDQLLDTIVAETVRILGADRASLFLLDEKSNQIWSKIATGLNKGQEIRLKKNQGIVGSVISTGKALNIPDAYGDPRFNRKIDQFTGYDTKNILCFPLKTFEGEVIGAFQVLNKEEGSFTHEDEQTLSLLASQACVAIENVQQYRKSVERHETLSTENQHLKKQLVGKYAYPAFVGDSPPILDVKKAMDKVSTTNANVLITGESGTGKELIARAVHSKSARANRRFVALNCAALPESLLESELFGIEKGVATGVAKRIGYFEQADQGTLFLDEIGEMPIAMQAKLLRTLQEQAFMRVGGSREIQVDVRVIAASNHDLWQAIQDGKFREDLFYRLNVFPIHLPALRDRGNDIPMLAKFILGNVVEKMNLSEKFFSDESLEAVLTYSWPGNVRELENTIERAVILTDGPLVDLKSTVVEMGLGGPGAVAAEMAAAPPASGSLGQRNFDPEHPNMKDAVKSLEIEMISEVLEQTRGNQIRAAKTLGISREGLRKKMARYNLERRSG
ncbi:MAG: sigma 54-interacting transcriptional regulator [SAR324 cluster bacterium]|nr:sigma 54-interacting transcriptional regulator [SAR324 cluster bacterium]MCZ6556550.1 sigma 54-interacting transcriptional regulator [SAR324 cluster bacterium]MCZ6647114.1 sigma 54-interacting transcriptional regulator [SAR324 cluster bacterium]MCZ6728532.1 sigma 54-interacting transcriptional regulator [SAR324 cluster bacterium]MCZ6843377.1 sigma 54-interacting transcriptional regulator [SAR324 cluster bacterium]